MGDCPLRAPPRAPTGTHGMEELFIDAEQVYERVQAGAKLIDVRTAAEVAHVALPGALHIPLARLADEVFAHIAASDTVICFCLSGARSDEATRWLRRHGVANAFNGGGIYPLLDAFDVDVGDIGGGGARSKG